MDSAEVFIGLGSNIRPEHNLRMALGWLHQQYNSVQQSPVYRSRAVGFDGDDFLNMVVAVHSRESAAAIKQRCKAWEQQAGRDANSQSFRPRTLDLDLLLYGTHISEEPTLPHPDILRYDFVLRPLSELAPNQRHPVAGLSFASLWQNHPDQAQAKLTTTTL